MQDKDEIIKGLLTSKMKIVADRNERFAMIQEELQDLKRELNARCQNIKAEISEFINKNN